MMDRLIKIAQLEAITKPEILDYKSIYLNHTLSLSNYVAFGLLITKKSCSHK